MQGMTDRMPDSGETVDELLDGVDVNAIDQQEVARRCGIELADLPIAEDFLREIFVYRKYWSSVALPAVVAAVRSGEFEPADLGKRVKKYLDEVDALLRLTPPPTAYDVMPAAEFRKYIAALVRINESAVDNGLDIERFRLPPEQNGNLRLLDLDYCQSGYCPFLKVLHDGKVPPTAQATNKDGETVRNFTAPGQVLDYAESTLLARAREFHREMMTGIIKFGEEAGPEYATIVSKMLHAANSGIQFGHESAEESSTITREKNEFYEQLPPDRKIVLGRALKLAHKWPQDFSSIRYFDEITVKVFALLILSNVQELSVITEHAANFIGNIYLNELYSNPWGRDDHREKKVLVKILEIVEMVASVLSVMEARIELTSGGVRRTEEVKADSVLNNEMALMDCVNAYIEVHAGKDVAKKWGTERRRYMEAERKSFSAAHTNAARKNSEVVFNCLNKVPAREEDSSHFAGRYFILMEAMCAGKGERIDINKICQCIDEIRDGYEFYEIFNILKQITGCDITPALDRLRSVAAKNPRFFNLGREGVSRETGDEFFGHRQVFDFLFENAEQMKSAPALVTHFMGILKNPQYRSFYTACCIAGDSLAREATAEFFADQLIKDCFVSGNDFADPNRIAILRNITERIPARAATAFLEKVAKIIALRSVDKSKFVLMLGEKCASVFMPIVEKAEEEAKASGVGAVKLTRAQRAAAETEKANAGVKLLAQTDLASLSESSPDIAALIKDLVDHRTIQLGTDGQRVLLEGHAKSPLATTFSDMRVRRRAAKETAQNPKSLACNIALLAKDDVTLYGQLDHDGNLELRILKGGVEIAVISRNKCGDYGVAERAFDEVHVLILEALGLIYKKKDFTPPPVAAKPATVTPPLVIPSGVPPPKAPEFTTLMPPVDEREESSMKIDLTEGSLRIHRERAQHEKILIGSNRDRARSLFQPIINGGNANGELPEDAFDVELFRMVSVGPRGGSRVPAKINDVKALYEEVATSEHPKELLSGILIRKTRAHSRAVPYTKHRHTFVDESNGTEHGLYTVSRGRRSELAELKHGEHVREGGEGLALGEFDGFMLFEVEDTLHTERLYQRVESASYMNDFLRARQKEIVEELDYRREEILRRSREQNEAGRLIGVKNDPSQELEYLQQEIAGRLEETAKSIEGMSARVSHESFWIEDPSVPEGRSVKTVINLPEAGYQFDHTFNQGHLESLEEFLGLRAEAGQEEPTGE